MEFMPVSPEYAVRFVWWASLALGVVVSLVVALLLWLIHRTAVTIDASVAQIWSHVTPADLAMRSAARCFGSLS